MGLKYKNLIASGCSFTAGSIGGVPPTLESEGGCSFIDDVDFRASDPQAWAEFLAQLLDVKSFVNLASGSHGISLTVNSIVEVLNKFNYTPADTLIVFNITDPARADIPCDTNHHEKSEWIPWDHNIIPYSYINRRSKIIKNHEKHQGIEQVEIANSNLLELFIDMLKYRNFDFYFLLMKNYLNHPHLGKIIEKNSEHLVLLDNHANMYDYSVSHNLLKDDQFHPSLQAHKNISNIVFETITRK